jgi:hypothetical protein
MIIAIIIQTKFHNPPASDSDHERTSEGLNELLVVILGIGVVVLVGMTSQATLFDQHALALTRSTHYPVNGVFLYDRAIYYHSRL